MDYLDADAYGFGSDQDGSSEDTPPLSWRLDDDGSDNLSDWTIVVTRPCGESPSSSVAYHVHKVILAIGPRKSEYFASLFKSQHNVSEFSTSTSTIELEDSAADAFPAMLTFFYSSDGKADLTTENSVAMRYLAQYFRIRQLFVTATEFIKCDFCHENAPVYLAEAATYRDEKLANAAEDMCAENMDEIDPKSFVVLPADLFHSIFGSGKFKCKSEGLSQIVSTYFESHLDRIDAVMFMTMTGKTIMPSVHPRAAFSLLKALVFFGSSDQISEEHKDDVKTRCISAISSFWTETIVEPLQNLDTPSEASDDMISTHRELPQELQIELLENSLLAAKDALKLRDDEINSLTREIRKYTRMMGNANLYVYSNSIYGSGQHHPPTAMPPNEGVEQGYGCVFNEGSNKWPVYYYKAH